MKRLHFEILFYVIIAASAACITSMLRTGEPFPGFNRLTAGEETNHNAPAEVWTHNKYYDANTIATPIDVVTVRPFEGAFIDHHRALSFIMDSGAWRWCALKTIDDAHTWTPATVYRGELTTRDIRLPDPDAVADVGILVIFRCEQRTTITWARSEGIVYPKGSLPTRPITSTTFERGSHILQLDPHRIPIGDGHRRFIWSLNSTGDNTLAAEQ
jgi:hypothetical protein